MPSWVWIVIIWIAYEIGNYLIKSLKFEKQRAAASNFQKSLSLGDEVILSDGIHGRIVRLDTATADLRIGGDSIITVERFAIVMTKDQLNERVNQKVK